MDIRNDGVSNVRGLLRESPAIGERAREATRSSRRPTLTRMWPSSGGAPGLRTKIPRRSNSSTMASARAREPTLKHTKFVNEGKVGHPSSLPSTRYSSRPRRISRLTLFDERAIAQSGQSAGLSNAIDGEVQTNLLKRGDHAGRSPGRTRYAAPPNRIFSKTCASEPPADRPYRPSTPRPKNPCRLHPKRAARPREGSREIAPRRAASPPNRWDCRGWPDTPCADGAGGPVPRARPNARPPFLHTERWLPDRRNPRRGT